MQYSQKENENPDVQIDQALQALERVRHFDGPPQDFWPAFLEAASMLADARFGFLLIQTRDEAHWRTVSLWPVGKAADVRGLGVGSTIESVAAACASGRPAWAAAQSTAPGKLSGYAVGVGLDLGEDDRRSVIVFFVQGIEAEHIDELLIRIQLVADIPVAYQKNRMAAQAKHDVVQYAQALDLMTVINAEDRFMGAAMAFCNEVASRYHCQRVALGWLDGAYMRVQAISHLEQFEKKMDSVQGLEAAMEEAFDQDEEIIYPPFPDTGTVVRDHEAYCRSQGTENMASLPLRVADSPIAVISCERSDSFSEIDIRGLRVMCDQAARRLSDLKRHDRWFGARAASALRDGMGRFLGVEHTFAKALGVILALLLAFALFGKLSYRVEGKFIIRTDDLAYLPSPFDGYIRDVHIKVGDLVSKGDLLLSLDTRELLLEESNALANQNRYMREAEKARAQNALADMRIAQALVTQADAQLDMVRHHLANSEIKAPFEGIIVEGDLKELLGAPVRKGDVLFKVARLDKVYAEIEVQESDIHEIAVDNDGEIAFVSRPDLKFPFTVERIDPVALPKEEGNVFLVRGVLMDTPPSWWRPGMSGITKINVGKRNVMWILTHRTVDFFRMLLWW
jgi:multidrug resistance efflux pump